MRGSWSPVPCHSLEVSIRPRVPRPRRYEVGPSTIEIELGVITTEEIESVHVTERHYVYAQSEDLRQLVGTYA